MSLRHLVGTFIQPFRERATNYRALLRKVNYKDHSSCGSSPPCRDIHIGFSGKGIYQMNDLYSSLFAKEPYN